MIKAETNITGTICRNAVVRTDKNNIPYLSFAMTVNMASSADQSIMPITVYVSVPNGQQNDLSLYVENKRISVYGTMDIHKKDDSLTFFLSAKHIITEGVSELDSFTGTMTFRGHLKTDNVYEEKTAKQNGKPYLRFSAYSAEKDGENFVSTWVNFVRFPQKDASLDSIKEEWMTAKAHVCIKGTLELEVYKGRININSRVLEMSQYVKQNSQEQP